MSKWQPIWLALCFVIVYGANRALAPSVPYEMATAARTMPTGSAKLELGGGGHELKLATAQVVSNELRPLLAEPKPVRVIWLRAIEDGNGGEPDLELFLDLTGGGSGRGANADDPASLRDQTLGVLAVAPGSSARSHVRLPGDSAPRRVRTGTVHVARVLAIDAATESARSRLEGTFNLSLESGSGDVGTLRGSFDARLAR